MKKVFIIILITIIITGGICYFGYTHQDEIYTYYQYKVLKVRDNLKINKNEYYKNVNYNYIQNTDDFIAKNPKHLMNIFYTIVNSGTTEFTFYCSDEYTNCTNDTVSLIKNDEILSDINNFVHPYNSFENIHTSYDKYGKVIVKIDKVYTNDDINKINSVVDKILKNNITSKMSNKKKITIIHNYIINHGKYATDSIRAKNPNKQYNKANDILIDGYGLCSSYADAMAIFLHRLNINNYKIASNTHIWNLVYLNNKWLHVDVTWDDPVTSNGTNKLEKIFLLIDTKRLKELNIKKHDYNKNVYSEAK